MMVLGVVPVAGEIRSQPTDVLADQLRPVRLPLTVIPCATESCPARRVALKEVAESVTVSDLTTISDGGPSEVQEFNSQATARTEQREIQDFILMLS